jgi:hypothetical protein
MTELTQIRDVVGDAAQLVAARPVDEWGQWIGYLMEALDAEAHEREQDGAYRLVLATVIDDVKARLDAGRW